ncbi:MAG: SRPBCC family protein [Promethearchaeota archaeon]|nr:MAG: SRPBCC family protein [Candidatus Lokiarchaeota archaeon]
MQLKRDEYKIPELTKTREVNASAETVFKIIDDDPNYAVWNIVINEVIVQGPGKYHFKTNVGDVYSTRMETIQNERIYAKQEGSPITGFAYDIKPKGDKVEVDITVEFDDPNQEAILGMAGEVFADCLKNYAEYLESGGNPDEYDKKKK